LVYEGSFENGKRTGRIAKTYWPNGNLGFEGCLLEGLRSGRGKEYDSNGRLKYSGNFEQDLYSGEGTLYYKHLRKQVKEYTGCFLGGVKSGDGILFHDNGKIYYSGEFVDGHPHGSCCKVFDENSSLWYKGALVAGQKSG
jgi:antitoxin component YwqK of YwqJK toxin-antitoxin module